MGKVRESALRVQDFPAPKGIEMPLDRPVDPAPTHALPPVVVIVLRRPHGIDPHEHLKGARREEIVAKLPTIELLTRFNLLLPQNRTYTCSAPPQRVVNLKSTLKGTFSHGHFSLVSVSIVLTTIGLIMSSSFG